MKLSEPKMICPRCHGNGYVGTEDGPDDCPMCDSQGEIPETKNLHELQGEY
jgi:DnaJ-class molecular chaperone